MMFRQNLLSVFSPFPLVLSLDPTKKSLFQSCLHTVSRYVDQQGSLSLLISRINRPISLSLSSQGRCSSPSITFLVFHWGLSSTLMYLLHWGGQNWTQYYRYGLTSVIHNVSETYTGCVFLMKPKSEAWYVTTDAKTLMKWENIVTKIQHLFFFLFVFWRSRQDFS